MGLGALGAWAAGSGEEGRRKSPEEEAEEAKSNAIKMHRESVLWFLRSKLQEAGQAQAEMMEKRILREMEKNKSVLARTRRASIPGLGGFEGGSSVPGKAAGFSRKGSSAGAGGLNAVQLESRELNPEEELSEEQIQMFEKENQDMLKHYESTLDQVRYGRFIATECYVFWHSLFSPHFIFFSFLSSNALFTSLLGTRTTNANHFAGLQDGRKIPH